jgi:hypothetical protein
MSVVATDAVGQRQFRTSAARRHGDQVEEEGDGTRRVPVDDHVALLVGRAERGDAGDRIAFSRAPSANALAGCRAPNAPSSAVQPPQLAGGARTAGSRRAAYTEPGLTCQPLRRVAVVVASHDQPLQRAAGREGAERRQQGSATGSAPEHDLVADAGVGARPSGPLSSWARGGPRGRPTPAEAIAALKARRGRLCWGGAKRVSAEILRGARTWPPRYRSESDGRAGVGIDARPRSRMMNLAGSATRLSPSSARAPRERRSELPSFEVAAPLHVAVVIDRPRVDECADVVHKPVDARAPPGSASRRPRASPIRGSRARPHRHEAPNCRARATVCASARGGA